MITAWSTRRTRRARVPAGPLPRLLGLALVLFAVVLLHGAHAESAGGHLMTSSVAPVTPPPAHPLAAAEAHTAAPAQHLVLRPAAAPGDAHEGRGDHGTGHPAEHCASAQPNQGPALAQPRCAASISEATAPACAPGARHIGAARPSDPSGVTVRSLVVRQI
ncbi:hypothetical protein [Streptomyces neyagawaensis]|uniref:hypothetical protein n=1 Tax=Streptomyces neyagawaensis TaxID=42238 RepID=UPI00201D212D|nr:hypothetical protein [Streptomyces neyagawaensis]MCL6732439.1 hypothetical protein [Streptomyces neyagawaensis]MDE1685921.1 hypothetical protein [Streptomyces neyagawaensis]